MKSTKQLIENYLSQNKLRKIDLIRRMNYKNEARGLRRLQELTETGKYSKKFIADLAEAMNIEQDVLKSALERDEKRQKELAEAEARRRFRPHIYLLNEKARPSSLLPLMVLGMDYYKRIDLPEDIEQLPLWEQIEKVKEIFTAYLREKGNEYSPFGKIRGFRYYYQFDEYAEFTIEGEIKGYYSGSSIQGQIITNIGGKKIEGGLLKRK